MLKEGLSRVLMSIGEIGERLEGAKGRSDEGEGERKGKEGWMF